MAGNVEHSAISQAAKDIVNRGYAIVQLSDLQSGILHRAIGSAAEFFQRPLEDKLLYSRADHNYGFRPFGLEYGITPERPDMNESFNFWSNRRDLIPHAQDIPELMSACLEWRDTLAPLVKGILDDIAKSFGAETGPSFEKAAYLQTNYFAPMSFERDMLQDKHEDVHLLTLLHATTPGLEIYAEGEDSETVLPILPERNQVLVMPGSTLTTLSSGAIKPMYHRVRNHGLSRRQSIMYFINPELDEPLYSWIDAEKSVDIREYVQNAPLMFGLPRVEAL
ncbi:2OG-Fe(II) oxygenase [Thozetella sp. PMI_491]|nr:2OG-Fe(II) oxygenase [Thozetella sp. PMI_491]